LFCSNHDFIFFSFLKVLDPGSGNIYQGKIWLENDSTLKLRGYAGLFDIFYRTESWKRSNWTNGKSPEGEWVTYDETTGLEKSIVQLRIVNGRLNGKISKIFVLSHEGENPICIRCKGDLKNRYILGMRIMWGFNNKAGKWFNGKILDPGNGVIYRSSALINQDGNLFVIGSWGPFFRTQIWERVK